MKYAYIEIFVSLCNCRKYCIIHINIDIYQKYNLNKITFYILIIHQLRVINRCQR